MQIKNTCDICWQENPFAERICVVFSTKSGTMNFAEFLNMLSVFSASASRDIKSMYAFKIYGMTAYSLCLFYSDICTRRSATAQIARIVPHKPYVAKKYRL